MSTQLNGRLVADYMQRDVVSVNPRDTVHDALQLMIENRVAALPVVTGKGVCVGVLSTTDIIELAYAAGEELENLVSGGASTDWLVASVRGQMGRNTVEEVMSSPVASVSAATPVTAAAGLMVRDRIHRLPVVDDRGQLVGIISTMDIMSLVAEHEDAVP